MYSYLSKKLLAVLINQQEIKRGLYIKKKKEVIFTRYSSDRNYLVEELCGINVLFLTASDPTSDYPPCKSILSQSSPPFE